MERQALSTEEADQIRRAHARFTGCRQSTADLPGTIGETTRRSLTHGIVSLLSSMSAGTGPAALLIENLVGEIDLPPTPNQSTGDPDAALNLLSEVVLLGMAATLGEPLAYSAEKSGALVQSVFPVESEREAPSNESSASILNLHTELVFSRRNPTRPLDIDSPDFILLGCLRSDPDGVAATLVSQVDDLCSGISPEHLLLLSEPRFEHRAPYSFTRDEPGNRPWVGPAPIFRGEGRARRASFDLACGTRAIDAEAEGALTALRGTAGAAHATEAVHLRPGSLLILANRRCAHGRTRFPARFDGTDRWMLRVYVRHSLDGMQPADPARPRVF